MKKTVQKIGRLKRSSSYAVVQEQKRAPTTTTPTMQPPVFEGSKEFNLECSELSQREFSID
jgi:hypothetical protein